PLRAPPPRHQPRGLHCAPLGGLPDDDRARWPRLRWRRALRGSAADVPAERLDATARGARLQESLHRRPGRDPHPDDRVPAAWLGGGHALRSTALRGTATGSRAARGADRRAGRGERRQVSGPLLEITSLTISFGGL